MVVPREQHRDEGLRLRISDIAGCEVILSVASMTREVCCRAGCDTGDDDLAALFDCHVFDAFKHVQHRYFKNLCKAVGEKVSSSEGSAGDCDYSEDDDKVDDDESENEELMRWERDHG